MISLYKEINKNYAYIYYVETSNSDNLSITKLPEGKYNVNVQCRGNFITNIFIKATLRKGEIQNIKF